MTRLAQHTMMFALATIVGVAAGCKRDDPEHLKAVGQNVGSKVNGVLNKTNDRLQWCEGAEPQTAPVDVRVRQRLQWDRGLEGSTILVTSQGTLVELRGNVITSDQRQHAAELARSTTGVQEVREYLVVGTAPAN
jgi:hypothetical protein